MKRLAAPGHTLAIVAVLVCTACGGEPTGGGSDFEPGLDARPVNDACFGSVTAPPKLSDHPCFTGVPPAPSAATVPYDVKAPLWSDGADKGRRFALPDGAAFTTAATGHWELPPDGVLIKEFTLEGTRIETRLLVRDAEGAWLAYTYVWNAAQDDATLTADGATVVLDDLTWDVPTAAACFQCHTDAAGISLGLESGQMDRDLTYDATGRTADQIDTLRAVGLLDGDPERSPLADYRDSGADLDARARAYLHANCAHCHRPGGAGAGNVDFRASTALALMGACDEPPLRGDPLSSGGLIIAPGDPESSVLHFRMISLAPEWRMPPLASVRVDAEGGALIADWINSLDACP